MLPLLALVVLSSDAMILGVTFEIQKVAKVPLGGVWGQWETRNYRLGEHEICVGNRDCYSAIECLESYWNILAMIYCL